MDPKTVCYSPYDKNPLNGIPDLWKPSSVFRIDFGAFMITNVITKNRESNGRLYDFCPCEEGVSL